MISFAAGMSNDENSWWSARRDATGISPKPEAHKDAVIQVFAARTWGWRGNLAVHTWIVMKPENAKAYDRYEVIGWRAYNGGDALVRRKGGPDNHWYGNPPQTLVDIRGEEAAGLIEKVRSVITAYPHRATYRLWPGPNSNTFIAHIGRQVPELELDMPPTAIGKDFMAGGALAGPAVSGQGVQLSLFGLAGFAVSPVEGIELHLLGFTIGVDFDDAALKMPGFGRVSLF